MTDQQIEGTPRTRLTSAGVQWGWVCDECGQSETNGAKHLATQGADQHEFAAGHLRVARRPDHDGQPKRDHN